MGTEAAIGEHQPGDESSDSNEGVRDAIESMIRENEVSGLYLLVALALAVAWWQAIGAMSGWIAGLGLIVLSFSAPRALTAVSMLRWPTAEGVVIESSVLTEGEAREYAGLGTSGDATETGYVPLIRYEYTVDGTRYESARVSPFDGALSRRRWAKTLIDEYPRNKHFSVRYDPADPANTYLRAWVRSKYVLFLGIGAALLAVAGWFAVGLPGGAPAVMTVIGLFLLGFGLYQFRVGFGSGNWPTVDATVTGPSISVQGGGDDAKTSYVPEFHYEYEVNDTSYVGSRYSFGGSNVPSFDAREKAQAWIDEHCPVDGQIPVHYNPDQPDVSVVEPGAWRSLVTVLAGLVFLGGAVLFYVFSGTAVPG